MRRARCVLALAAIVWGGLVGEASSQPRTSFTVAEVKAQFVERFTRFVDWPAAVRRQDRFTMCVAGSGDAVDALKALARKHQMQARPVVVRTVGADDDLTACWLLFVATNGEAAASSLLAKVDGAPVLTVGESAALSDSGVMMSFYRSGRRLRFEIDPDRIAASGLKARAKLLRLGRKARRK